MKYGYARVSTTDQKLANQIELLKLAGAEKIFQEKFTGTTTERPEFQKLLRVLKTGDTLIVRTCLDTLTFDLILVKLDQKQGFLIHEKLCTPL